MNKRNLYYIFIAILVAVFIAFSIWLWIDDGKRLKAERQVSLETGERQ